MRCVRICHALAFVIFINVEGQCDSLKNYVGRQNAKNIDLNRDFPDQFEPRIYSNSDILKGRQKETVAMMTWIRSEPFVLSGNIHGGAVVTSYPFDNSIDHNQCCKESLTPDDAVFKQLAKTYASPHPVMSKPNSCPNETFADGIVNGAFWYELSGGMQDYNYVNSNCFEVTFEISCCKYPNRTQLLDEWLQNKESLLSFIEATHMGVKGVVTDNNGNSIPEAVIVVKGIAHNITTTDRGEYWRLLVPGEYTIQAVAQGYESSKPELIKITENDTAIHNFTLSEVQTDRNGTRISFSSPIFSTSIYPTQLAIITIIMMLF